MSSILWWSLIPITVAVVLTLFAVAILYSDMRNRYTPEELDQLPPDARTIQARQFGTDDE